MTKTVPLRRLVDVIDCAHVTAEFVDDDRRFPVASIRECQGPFVDLSDCNYTTQEFFDHLRAGDRAPRAGDLLFIRNVSVGLVSAVEPGIPEFAIGQETVLLRRTSDADPTFLRYALVGAEAVHAIESAMIGATFRRINVSAIRALPVALPSPEEQRAIADYLDRETARIDTLIEEQQRLIETLSERRAALIAEKTGWGASRPDDWPMMRLSWLFQATGSGTTPANEDITYGEDADVPWVTTGELRESLIFGTARGVSADVVQRYSALKIHPAGSLLIAMYGATIGRMALLGVDATSNQACCALIGPKGADPEFVQYSLMAAKSWLLLEAAGGGQPNINQDKIRSFRIPVPGLDEQRRIVAYLNVQTAKIDTMIAEAERFIDLSRERRTALITAAVTGQIDVREIA